MTEAHSCPEISKLSSLLDDELDAGEKGPVKLHVTNCSSCADQLRRLGATDRILFSHLVKAMISSEDRKRNCLSPEAMTSYLHDLLSTEEKRRAENHLDLCDACLTEFQSLAKAEARLKQSPQEPLPHSLRQKVEGIWAEREGKKETLARVVVRLTKEGIEIVRDALFPPALGLQEVFASAGAYRSGEKSLLPKVVLLKERLADLQLSLMLQWQDENRAGLEVKIEDSKLAPVVGQRVFLRKNENLVFSERTGTDGTLLVPDLEPGTYQLGIRTADKEFYVDLEINNS
jgi:anti-sigma factor RsiW